MLKNPEDKGIKIANRLNLFSKCFSFQQTTIYLEYNELISWIIFALLRAVCYNPVIYTSSKTNLSNRNEYSFKCCMYFFNQHSFYRFRLYSFSRSNWFWSKPSELFKWFGQPSKLLIYRFEYCKESKRSIVTLNHSTVTNCFQRSRCKKNRKNIYLKQALEF